MGGGGGLCVVLGVQASPTVGQGERVEAVQPADVGAGDAVLQAQRATAFTRGGVQHVLLEGEVRVEAGNHALEATRAVVRIAEEGAGKRLVMVLEGARSVGGEGRVGIAAEAKRLLVTAPVSGSVRLSTDLMGRAATAPGDDFTAAALERIEEREATRTRGDESGQRVLPGESDVAGQATTGGSTILPAGGVVRIGRVDYFDYKPDATPGGEGAVVLAGGVQVLYEGAAGGDEPRAMSLRAERAVILLRPREADAEGGETGATPAVGPGSTFDAGDVVGVYLEDNAIATDGTYTVRAPRVFYDPSTNRALLLDAVLYSYDAKRGLPLYLRAEAVRQTSATRFVAEDAILTTSAFAEPEFAIGADRVVVEQTPRGEGDGVTRSFSASGATVRAGGVPVFYVPYLAGTDRESPVRSITAGADRSGFNVLTRIDPFALVGREQPEGVEAEMLLDYRGEHGPAISGEIEYDLDNDFGSARGYFLPHDEGTDNLARRRDIEHDGDARGFARLQHRHLLPSGWQADVGFAYVSDETFLDEFYNDEANEALPYDTSVYLLRQGADWQLTGLASGTLNDFTPQLYELATPGYVVERLPEVGYYRLGSSLWEDRLTLYSENRLSRLRIRGGDVSPFDRGFTQADSLTLFGFDNDLEFDEGLSDAGIPRDWRLRLDTRQEVQMPMMMGPVHVTPYAVGRVTAYDDDFEDFAGDGEDDSYRLWGAVGVRLSTQFHRDYRAGSDILGVDGLRHIIQPEVDLFAMGSTVDRGDLPVYDPEVERLADGPGVRLGVTQTLQTRRGGPDTGRSVDWITLRTDLILRDGDGEDFYSTDPVPRFHPYRPEYALGGDHFYSELFWLVSDTLGVTGDLTYNLESDDLAQWRVGLTMLHTPRLSSYVNYQVIDPLDSRLLTYGFSYDLTKKYRIGFRHRLDFSENESRSVRGSIERKFQQWTLAAIGEYDQLEDETTIGLILTPRGLGGQGLRTNLFDSRDRDD